MSISVCLIIGESTRCLGQRINRSVIKYTSLEGLTDEKVKLHKELTLPKTVVQRI